MTRFLAAAAAALLASVPARAQVGRGHAAAVLPDPSLGVLVTGGLGADGRPTAEAAIHGPDGSVTPVAPLSTARAEHSATPLYDGRVLVAGGTSGAGALATLELFELAPGEPLAGAFRPSAATLSVARRGHEALGLSDGRVLIRGGTAADGSVVAVDELYDPRTDTVSPAPANVAFASVGTDYLDYVPGQTVYVFGEGWRPGEDIFLLFDREPFESPPVVVTVTADARGEVYAEPSYVMGQDDYGARFTLHAVGATSAISAGSTFTDANGALGVDAADPIPSSVTVGQVVEVRVTAANHTNKLLKNVVVSVSVPSGWTAPPAQTLASLAAGASSVLGFTVPAAAVGSFTLNASVQTNDPVCSQGNITCAATRAVAPLTVTAPQLALGASVQPAGAGTLTCAGGACPSAVTSGTRVTFSAAPAAGFALDGWAVTPSSAAVSGCGGGSASCEVSVTTATDVQARFVALRFPVAYGVSPAGGGSLTCDGGACPATVGAGTQLDVQAAPSAGFALAGWTVAPQAAVVSGCTGAAAGCRIAVDGATSVAATFAKQTFQLTSGAQGTGTGSLACAGGPCAGTVEHGVEVTFEGSASAGSALTGWTVTPAAAVVAGCSGATSCTVAVTADTDVRATFSLAEHAIAIDALAHGAISCGAQGNEACPATASHGATVLFTATPEDGYHLLEWTGACAGQGGATCTLQVTDAVAVGATFTPDLKTLTIAPPDHGSIACPDSAGQQCPGKLALGADLVLAAVADAGYAFGEWTGACAGQGARCTLHVTADASVGATFVPSAEPLVLTVSPGGSVRCQVGTEASAPFDACLDSYPHGTTVTLVASENTGYAFSGWSGACGGALECTVVMNGRTAVDAAFAVVDEALAVSVEGPGSVRCDGAACAASYPYGSSVTLSAVPDEGAVFVGWGGACSGTGECTPTLSGATAVSARFEAVARSLTIRADGGAVACVTGGLEGPCPASYAHGSWVHLVAKPATGWSFAGWRDVCDGSTAPACDFQIVADTAAAAQFTQASAALRIGPVVGNGVVTCDGGACAASYPSGSRVAFEAVAAPGYLFAGWAGACDGELAETCARTLDADLTVGATFTLDPTSPTRSVKVTPSSSGRVSATFANGGTTPLACGAGVTSTAACNLNVAATTPAPVLVFQAAPVAGTRFVTWNPPCSGTNPTCTLAMTGSANVSAMFQPSEWKLTASTSAYAGTAGGSIAGTLARDGTRVLACTATSSAAPGCTAMIPNNGLAPAEVVTLVATPDATSIFRGWGGSCSGTAPTCTVTMNMAKSVVATFTPATFTLTAQPQGSGKGTVTAAGVGGNPGLRCTTGSTAGCSMIVPNGWPSTATEVELTATPADDTVWLAGWAGCTATGPTTCKVAVSAATWVSAKFLPRSYRVTISLSGTGRGSISGASCTTGWPRTCTVEVPTLATGQPSVTLTAAPEGGYAFGAWGWPCSGSTATSCAFTVGADTAVSASFK